MEWMSNYIQHVFVSEGIECVVCIFYRWYVDRSHVGNG